ncbi:MAG: hypothetical protein QOE90_870 [Thermoplasmata archaeon]|jgi:hypothetical protein|nr:hypothetical protein [Thermoplasmata archaeon]
MARTGARRAMRFAALLLTLLLAAGFAGAGAATGFVSSNNLCQPLLVVGISPPAPCPNVAQQGSATALGCDLAGRCQVSVSDVGTGQGLVVTKRQMSVRAQVNDLSEPAVQLCAVWAESGDVSCGGSATLSLPVAPGSCTRFRVEAAMEEIGDDVVHVLDVNTAFALDLCNDGFGAAHVEYA